MWKVLLILRERRVEIMENMKVDYMTLGALSTNCYFICNLNTMETVIVDPAAQADAIGKFVAAKGYNPVAVFLTHGHFDHILAVREVCDKYNIKFWMYETETELAQDPDANLSTSFMTPFIVEGAKTLTDNQVIEMAGMKFLVLHTPGHTSGSCCYYLPEENILISGDTLFCQSVGRSDFPTGSTSQLLRSIGEKLFVLPDNTVVYPGHGDATTIGYEKVHNCCAGMV